MTTLTDKLYMDYAIEMARSNPDVVTNKGVGALIVKDNHIVGMGVRHIWINFCGKEHRCVHAEAMALQEAGLNNVGSTLYVTTCPCSFRWHNSLSWPFPSCCDLIIKAGVNHVVIGDSDNDLGSEGMKILQNAGIAVKFLGLDLSFLTKNSTVDTRVLHERNKEFFK